MGYETWVWVVLFVLGVGMVSGQTSTTTPTGTPLPAGEQLDSVYTDAIPGCSVKNMPWGPVLTCQGTSVNKNFICDGTKLYVAMMDANLAGSSFQGCVFAGYFAKVNAVKTGWSAAKRLIFQDFEAIDSNFDESKMFVQFEQAEGSDVKSSVSGSTFRNAYLQGSWFLRLTVFENVSFEGADLTGVLMTGVFNDDSPGRVLSMTNIDFTGATLDGLSIQNANASGLIMKEASLFEANWFRAAFFNTSFNKVSFKNAKILDCNITACDLSSTSWVGAGLQNLLLQDMVVIGAKFDGSSIQECQGCPSLRTFRTTFRNSSFVGSQLSFSEFITSDLRDANFEKANLTKVVFSRTNISGASFLNANLYRANLIQAWGVETADVRNATFGYVLLPNNQTCESFCGNETHGRGCFCRAPLIATVPLSSPGCTPPCGSAECFPSTATVELDDGRIKTMRDLDVGDRVRVGPNSFSPIYFFGHRDQFVDFSYLAITLSDGSELSVSPGHFIYAFGPRRLVPSSELQPGYFIYSGNHTEVTLEIISIRRHVGRGLYAPHTLQGDLVVNGVLVSSYTSAVPASLAHLLLAPIRAAYLLGLPIPPLMDSALPISSFRF